MDAYTALFVLMWIMSLVLFFCAGGAVGQMWMAKELSKNVSKIQSTALDIVKGFKKNEQ